MMIDKRLLNAVPKSKKWVFLTVLLKWISLLLNAVLIFSLAQIIKTRGENILLPCIFIALSVIFSFLSSQLTSLTSFKSSAQVKKTLRSMIFEKLLKLGTDYQEQTQTAKIVQLAVEGVEQLEVWFGQYLPQFFYSMIASITTFAILAFLNLKMAIILLVCVPLIPLAIVAVQKIAKRILKNYWSQYANLADNFLENLQGLTTLEIYNADEFKQKSMAKEAEHFRKVTMKVLSMQLNSIIIMDIVAYGGAGLGITAAVASFLSGTLSLENCFVCILLSADFFIPLRRLGSYFHTAMNGATASNNIFELLDTKEKTDGSLFVDLSNLANQENQQNQILYETENLSYSFGERQVLQNVNIKIQNGSYTAFVGKSGSGKSTTAKILAGINSEYKGSVKFNGTELNQLKKSSLYKTCTYISHRDWIFKGSVKETLLEGNPNASEEEMWKVLDEVQLSSFLKENGGLEMQIEENAANLSGGQKQRLSIARALLFNSPIMIFDEATSNIDVESESAILKLLHELKGKKTILMISHRKENCLGADKIYLFENGNCKQESENSKSQEKVEASK